ncbi:hypothetical protein ACQB6R_02810 [Propionibacteriaceae bacterium G1746]|uniref:hypothetical protein n=1 Tax=Aestuariimicrobium sp. G57 TaxID=3418485 RepID=UPI003C1D965D
MTFPPSHPSRPVAPSRSRVSLALWLVLSVVVVVAIPAVLLGRSAYRSNPTWPTSRVQAILAEMDDHSGDEPIMAVELDRRNVRMTTLTADGGSRRQLWNSGEIVETTSQGAWTGRVGFELRHLNLDRAVELVREKSTTQLTIEAAGEGEDPTILLKTATGETPLNRNMEPR